MPAVGDGTRLIASESERMLVSVSLSCTRSCPRPIHQVGLRAVPRFDPTSTFPTPSMAAYGLLRSKHVAFALPRVTKQDSQSKENPEDHFSSP